MKKLLLFFALATTLCAQIFTAPLGKSINLTWEYTNNAPPAGGQFVVQEDHISGWVDVYSTTGWPSWTTLPAAGAHTWHVIVRMADGRESVPSNPVSVAIVEIVAPTPTPGPAPVVAPTNLVLQIL